MNTYSQRISAFIAYLFPVVGWVYVLIFQNKSKFAMFHLRQSISLILFLISVFAGWAVVAWLLVWIPLGTNFGVALFPIVILALGFGVVAWIMGMVNALRGKLAYLPIFGHTALRLPF